MCGICGVVDFTGRPIDPATIVEMRDVMVRRGPDAAGIRMLPKVGLGHRRLSIIDLSESANQPMSNEDGTVWVVLNGEIYDFNELRVALMRSGHRFRSGSDTEVLVHGYEEYGIEGLLARVNGMFAFAIWDANRDMLLLARDRLGKKPLYYGTLAGRTCFSSDIKSLWLASGRMLSVADAAIAQFLYWGYIPGPGTVFKGVRQLMPGSWARVAADGVEERSYWRLSFASKSPLSWADALDAVDAELRDAVRRRLRSDVPLGAFLSGGVDSSLIVHYMSQLLSEPVRTFSIGFDSAEHDERVFARRAARCCHTQHSERLVHADAKGRLLALVWEYGQPFGDAAAVSTSYVSEAAREEVTVALTGDGGDESFAGYTHHQGAVLGHLLASVLPGRLIDAFSRRIESRGVSRSGGRLSSFQRVVRYASDDPMLAWSSMDFWNGTQLAQLVAGGSREDRDQLLAPALDQMARFDGTGALDRALFLDLSMRLPFGYNVKVDVASMFSSLEARCPFLDYKLVELAASLPWHYKGRPGQPKHLLKRLAARYFPRDVIYRRKHGFSLPIDEWMSGSWAPLVERIVLGPEARRRGMFDYHYLTRLWQRHRSGEERHGHRFWLLLWLELWFQLVVEGATTVGDSMLEVGDGPLAASRVVAGAR